MVRRSRGITRDRIYRGRRWIAASDARTMRIIRPSFLPIARSDLDCAKHNRTVGFALGTSVLVARCGGHRADEQLLRKRQSHRASGRVAEDADGVDWNEWAGVHAFAWSRTLHGVPRLGRAEVVFPKRPGATLGRSSVVYTADRKAVLVAVEKDAVELAAAIYLHQRPASPLAAGKLSPELGNAHAESHGHVLPLGIGEPHISRRASATIATLGAGEP